MLEQSRSEGKMMEAIARGRKVWNLVGTGCYQWEGPQIFASSLWPQRYWRGPGRGTWDLTGVLQHWFLASVSWLLNDKRNVWKSISRYYINCNHWWSHSNFRYRPPATTHTAKGICKHFGILQLLFGVGQGRNYLQRGKLAVLELYILFTEKSETCIIMQIYEEKAQENHTHSGDATEESVKTSFSRSY